MQASTTDILIKGLYMKIRDVVTTTVKGLWGTDYATPEDGVAVIKTNNMSYEGVIDYSDICYRNIEVEKAQKNFLKHGDILAEKSGGTKTHTVGYVSYFDGQSDKFVCNNFILVIRPNVQKIKSKFLFYQMRYMYENGIFADCYNRTTGIQNLQVNSYLSKDIKVFSEAKQESVVSLLDSIIFEIDNLKKRVFSLGELVKSRFIEMFGHYFEDVRYFVKVGDIATATIGLTYKPDNVTDEGIIVLRSGNIQNAELCLSDDIVRVSNIKIKEDKFVRENDILMCSRNGSARLVGKCCLIPKLNEQMSYGAFMTVIRSRYPYFLNGFFNSTYFLQQLTGTQTASVNQITTGMLNGYTVIKPSDTEENEFAEFVKLIDKSKFIVQQQIKDLQELLDSKMDEYFR